MSAMIHWLDDDQLDFPPTRLAQGPESDLAGLLALGGDLSVARLQLAYAQGIFPWYSEGQPILWWSPDPRMVLQTQHFKLSRSLRKTLQKFRLDARCEIRVDHDLPAVLRACAQSPRVGQAGTWILPEMQDAYAALGRAGIAHSVETWVDNERVGGLYGVNIGRMFYGESMFSQATDASKIALAALVCLCRLNGIPWIDCQQNTRHLASLGAFEIARPAFEAHLSAVVNLPAPNAWIYHPSHWSALALGPL